jgi:hypothetical protein
VQPLQRHLPLSQLALPGLLPLSQPMRDAANMIKYPHHILHYTQFSYDNNMCQIDKTLTHASETWTLTKRDREQLNFFERKVYRRILAQYMTMKKKIGGY